MPKRGDKIVHRLKQKIRKIEDRFGRQTDKSRELRSQLDARRDYLRRQKEAE